MNVIRGKIPGAKKVVCYGPEGIGKSTFAAQFPEPLFIDTEGSTKDMDVARLETPGSWEMLLEEVRYVKSHPEICKTLVLDTADWAEMLCSTHICNKMQKNGIEDFGYGKGYTYLQEEFGRLLNLFEEIVSVGVNVVITAHAKMRKFEQPDELGSYDRWEMKLTKQTAPMVKEWADIVLFANYKTYVINVDGQGTQKGKNKAQGGKRTLYTTHHSCWDAKNRYGLPEEIEFDYQKIRSIIEPVSEVKEEEQSVTIESDKPAVPAPEFRTDKSTAESETKANAAPPVGAEQEPVKEEYKPPAKIDERVPKNLRDLMLANSIDEWDIQNVCEAKGYVPQGTPVYLYEEVNPGFTDGVLVAAWSKVYEEIKKMKADDAIVFN